MRASCQLKCERASATSLRIPGICWAEKEKKAYRRKEERLHEMQNAGSLGRPGIQTVDYGLVIGVEQYVLSQPLVSQDGGGKAIGKNSLYVMDSYS